MNAKIPVFVICVESFISYYITCTIQTLKSYFKQEIFVLHGVFLLICSTKSFFSNEKKISGNTEALFGKEALGDYRGKVLNENSIVGRS